MHNDAVRPTRIQHSSRLSYDKMMNHFDELEGNRMVYRDRGKLVKAEHSPNNIMN